MIRPEMLRDFLDNGPFVIHKLFSGYRPWQESLQLRNSLLALTYIVWRVNQRLARTPIELVLGDQTHTLSNMVIKQTYAGGFSAGFTWINQGQFFDDHLIIAGMDVFFEGILESADQKVTSSLGFTRMGREKVIRDDTLIMLASMIMDAQHEAIDLMSSLNDSAPATPRTFKEGDRVFCLGLANFMLACHDVVTVGLSVVENGDTPAVRDMILINPVTQRTVLASSSGYGTEAEWRKLYGHFNKTIPQYREPLQPTDEEDQFFTYCMVTTETIYTDYCKSKDEKTNR